MTFQQRSELMELATKAFNYNYEYGYVYAHNDLEKLNALSTLPDSEYEFLNFLYNIPLIQEDKLETTQQTSNPQ